MTPGIEMHSGKQADTTMLHCSLAELETALDYIRQSPQDLGNLVSIVIRPQKGERTLLTSCELSPELGVHGDSWVRRDSPRPEAQVTLINSRVIALLARTPQRRPLSGDLLHVDIDLSVDNFQPGQQFTIGEAMLEVTSKLHRGCKKFVERFGANALSFVNSTQGARLRLRGMYARVVRAGMVKVGDTILKHRE